MTQSAVAELAGLAQTNLSAIESGKVDVRLSTIEEIARALRLEIVLVPLESAPALRRTFEEPRLGEPRRLFRLDPD